jgi:hypothetical protein
VERCKQLSVGFGMPYTTPDTAYPPHFTCQDTVYRILTLPLECARPQGGRHATCNLSDLIATTTDVVPDRVELACALVRYLPQTAQRDRMFIFVVLDAEGDNSVVGTPHTDKHCAAAHFTLGIVEYAARVLTASEFCPREPLAEMLSKCILLKSRATASWGSTTLTNPSGPRCSPPQGSCGGTWASKSPAIAFGKASTSPANDAR